MVLLFNLNMIKDIPEYTGTCFISTEPDNPNGILQDRITKGYWNHILDLRFENRKLKEGYEFICPLCETKAIKRSIFTEVCSGGCWRNLEWMSKLLKVDEKEIENDNV